MEQNEKKELLSQTVEELEEWFLSAGEAKYRAKQLFPQLHKGLSPQQMSNLGKRVQEKLAASFSWHLPVVEQKLVSAIDGTVKYLFGLADGHCVESVVMKYEHGNTICISSQVGCRMGCKFCASTIGGRVRDLSAGELLGQVIAAQKDMGERISNIVMMGIGEPLDNYDNVIRFLRLVNCEEGLNIGYRHISLSTCGLIEGIRRLQEEDLPITLSISLHAPDDETRSAIMPINKKYGVSALLGACKEYFAHTGRKISFEYTLIAGKNDSVENARKLADVLNSHLRTRTEGMPIHVNLIPVNEVSETGFRRSGREAVAAFQRALESKGIRATVRRKLGSDINASCGQLRRAAMKEKQTPKQGENQCITDTAE
ncbi:MAG: 23S rRNA (adenine(2503)-C(2))-methyltransferase RlmN [Clostridia bacterium]|nr:23S rRNA (adenine(2503)-C(2))-methyltransferase RlmN [Clostridia bacterium]